MEFSEVKELIKFIEEPVVLEEVKSQGEHAVGIAKELVIVTQEDADRASTDLADMEEKIDNTLAKIKPNKDRANKVHKYFTGLERLLDSFIEAKKITNRKLSDHEIKKRQEAAEAQRKADEEARLEAAIEAEEEENTGLSGAIMEGHVPVTAAPVEKTKTVGRNHAEVWKHEVIDMDRFFKEAPEVYIIKEPNNKMLSSLATSQKERAKVPGVKFYLDLQTRKASKGMTTRSW